MRFSPEAIQIKRGMFFMNRFLDIAQRNGASWRYWCLAYPDQYKAQLKPKPFSVRAKRRCVKAQLSIIGCLTIPHRRRV